MAFLVLDDLLRVVCFVPVLLAVSCLKTSLQENFIVKLMPGMRVLHPMTKIVVIMISVLMMIVIGMTIISESINLFNCGLKAHDYKIQLNGKVNNC